MYAFLLAASFATLSLAGGLFTMNVPASVHLKKQDVNFETSAYNLYSGSDPRPLLTVIAGGGSYDLGHFHKTCLNGSPAWMHDVGTSGTVVVGQPGSWAVAAYWKDLKGSQISTARAIISSIRLNPEEKC